MLRSLRPNSWTKSSQKFSSLLFTISSTPLLEIYISSNSRNLLQFLVQLLYTVKQKGEKPDRKPYPFPNPYRNLKSENYDYGQNLKEIVRS